MVAWKTYKMWLGCIWDWLKHKLWESKWRCLGCNY